MKVVLLKEVEKLGKAGEIKQVSDGFARNYLIPKKMAKPATQKAIEKVEEQLKKELEKNKEELRRNQKLAEEIKKEEIIIRKKAKKGKLFGSVTEEDIVKALKEKHIDTKESNIKMNKQIKEAGEYEIKISLNHGIEAELKVIIEEEE
ncbi:MAG: 50S ribosomal protein L9 [Candidatus Moraniibacteriota bacterium]